MTTKILSLGDYYLNKDGWFVRKSPWIKRIKYLVSVLFLFAVFIPNESAISYVQTSVGDFVNGKLSPPVKEVVYFDYIKKQNSELTNSEISSIVNSALKWSDEFNIDEKMILAIMTVESSFNKHAISNAGAFGLMQVIPKWHLEKIVEARKRFNNPELFDLNTNIFLGSWIYKDCLSKFKKNDKALLCYNGSNEMPNGYDKKVILAYNDISKQIRQVR